MALNLRVGFKKRQRKCLSKSLSTTHPPTKRTRPEDSHEEPVPDAPMVQVSPPDVTRSSQELVMSSFVEKDARPEQERTAGQTLGDDNNDKDVPVSSPTPSWEEIATLLKQVPYFTAPEPLSTSMDDFFSLTHRFCVDMSSDPRSLLSSLAFRMELRNPFFSAFSRYRSILLLRRWK